MITYNREAQRKVEEEQKPSFAPNRPLPIPTIGKQ